MVRHSFPTPQALEMLSPWFLALIALVALAAFALAVTFVVTSGAGLHLAQAAQSAAHSLLASIASIRPLCSGTGSSCD